MKNLLTKSLVLVFIVSLLFSFAACGKYKDDTTTGVPTTTQASTTEFTTEQVTVSEPLSVELIKVALSSAGETSWDGDFASLNDEQKQTISDYFAATGKTVEFRDGNIYLVQSSDGPTTSDEATTASGVEGTTKKPSGGNTNVTKPQEKPEKDKVDEALKTPTGAVLSYLYNEDEQFFYVEDDPWQREFGFNKIYDGAANFAVMYYDTVRVKFNYSGKDWMIQMWKGQYGMVFIGAEIGVYTKDPTQTVDHYDCASDDDSLKMQMSLYDGDKWMFTRSYDTYWWVTGFVPGTLPRFNDRSGLTMLAMITLKDKAMTGHFLESLKGNGFKKGYTGFSTHDTYKVEGNTVYINWRYCKGGSALTRITFDAAGGQGGTGPTAMQFGTELMPPEVTKEGHTLLGWKKPLGRLLVFPQTVPSGHTTYIAQWSINSYTVTFDANGGDGDSAPKTQKYNSDVTLPTSGFIKSGHTFTGWNTTPAAKTALSDYKVPAKDVTLYAVYTAN